MLNVSIVFIRFIVADDQLAVIFIAVSDDYHRAFF
jgi:hypothetical protein